MNDCVFCKIKNKELPSNIYFETDDMFVLKPLHQVSKGHLLLIPKDHFADILDIPETLLVSIIKAAKQISIEIIDTTTASGINLLNASGVDAQQSVFHFHLHLVPRYKNDGLDMWIKQGL